MKRKNINYPMIIKSAKDLDFKKIFADTLDIVISLDLSFSLHSRVFLDHCETFLVNCGFLGVLGRANRVC